MKQGKIVGIQYYKGIASRGEWVQLLREPNNPVCAKSSVPRTNSAHIICGELPGL